MTFRWDRCFYLHCGVLHTQSTALVSMTGKNPNSPDMNLASANAHEWSFSLSSVKGLLSRNAANAAVFADLRPFNYKGEVYVGHWVKFGWESNVVPTDHSACWSEYNGRFSCDYMAVSRLNFDTQQIELIYHFRQSMFGTPYRMEKNWAFLEHGTKLIVIYSLLPCTVLFVFNPKAPKGAVFHSGFCYQNLTQVEAATGLALQDAHAGYLKEALIVGSFHELKGAHGQRVVRLLLGQGDQYSGYEDVHPATMQWTPMSFPYQLKSLDSLLDAKLDYSRERNKQPH
ncbi:hypothetical protein WJX73_010011 [Symbiochloris irregularis]|uniref:Uncharacterized protein n=1 Tax=Symbiochloris irregularis TaxID=706552 RepID=A0AAW1NTI5_9CHLO